MPNDTAPNPKIQPISRVPSSTPQVKHGGQLARSSRQAGTTVASTQSATTASKASGQPKQIQVKLKPVKGSGTGGEMDEADITITLASRQDTPLLESPSPDHIWKKPDQETGKKERREQGMRWKSHTRDKRGSNGEPGPRRWREQSLISASRISPSSYSKGRPPQDIHNRASGDRRKQWARPSTPPERGQQAHKAFFIGGRRCSWEWWQSESPASTTPPQGRGSRCCCASSGDVRGSRGARNRTCCRKDGRARNDR